MAPPVAWKFFVDRTDDEGAGGEWPLVGGEQALSRAPSPAGPHDLVVGPLDRDVSRPHALFATDGQGRVSALDCGSRYGTFLNGGRLEPCARVELESGDVVRAGSLLLTLAPASAPTRPPRKAVLARNGTPLKPDHLLFTRGRLSGVRLPLDAGPVLFGGERWATVRLVAERYRGARVVVTPAGAGGHRAVDASDEPRLRVNGERAAELRLEHGDVLEIGGDLALTYVVYRQTRACKVAAARTRVPA